MVIGRIKIWFATGKKTCFLGRKGFFKRILGWEVVRWLSESKTKENSRGGIQVSRTMRAAKKFAEEKGQVVLDYGYTTYWVWRFRLTIHTPEYHSKNPW